MDLRSTIVLILAAGCNPVAATSTVDAASDHDATTGTRTCAASSPFGAPMVIPGLSTLPGNGTPGGSVRLSRDELTIVFSDTVDNHSDLFVAHRAALDQPFSTPQAMTAVNSSSDEFDPMISADGLRLWFSSNRGAPNLHLFVATRPSTLVDFGPPGPATVNSADPASSDAQPFETSGGDEVWFSSNRVLGNGSNHIFHAVAQNGSFGAAAPVAELSSSADDWWPAISSDGLTIYVTSSRAAPGSKGSFEIWRATRARVTDPFAAPVLVDELDTPGIDSATWLSDDSCRIYGYSDGSGTPHLYVATRQP